MNYTEFLLEYFNERLVHTTWLVDKDVVYADYYTSLYNNIVSAEYISEKTLFNFTDSVDALVDIFDKRVRDPSMWVATKKTAANELTHDDNGKLTTKSLDLLRTAISDKNGEKTLISDTGKTVAFGEKWYTMIQSCGFKDIAIERLTDFISKFIEENGWAKYFVGNIGKNNKSLIQEYHPMDTYNLKHDTSYAAMHLGNTRRCVIVSVDTVSADGRGEPSSITFLEIGAHTLIDRFDENYHKYSSGRTITEATIDELATLLDID